MTHTLFTEKYSEEFRTFFEQHYRIIFRSLLARTGSHSDSEDLTQETFVHAARHFGLPEIKPSLHWLQTISSNVFKNWLRYHQSAKRSGQKQSIDEQTTMLSSEQRNQEEQLIARQNMRILSIAIANLPNQMRRCFVLFFIQKYKYEEIASHTGTSVQTVKSQVSRGRKKVVVSCQQMQILGGSGS